uniref:DUF148 domain-containing protein n=1 Tax=Panagrolaimus sp. PS1159 TaxID=55785 RepID=A0AC35FT64_9BILA
MSSFKNFILIAFLSTFAISQISADHPKNIVKRSNNNGPSLSNEKYQSVLKVYTEEGPLEEKNRKADEVAKNFSDSEKKVVDAIKKFFGKRAEAIAKLDSETKSILKEIKQLRQQQKALFEKIKGEDKNAANFLLFGHAPQNLNSRSSSSSPSRSSSQDFS